MKTVVVGAIAVAAVLAPASAKANNTGVARQRMTAQLFAEYNSEETVEFEWGGYVRGYHRQLKMKEGPDATGATRWVPVELKVSCHGRSCIGRVWTEEFPQQYVLEDHAHFTGRKGTYHETGWKPPS